MAETLPRTVRVLEEGCEQKLHTGAQVYISLNGDVLVDGAWGESQDSVTMAADAIVPWLSCTKPVTAVAFAQCVEEGQVAFDTPVVEVIPEFGAGGKRPITFRNLLTHTAGLHLVTVAWHTSFEDLVASICVARTSEDWVPGARAAYDPGAGWCILGEAIQRITGEGLGDVLRDNIFDPLGMSDSWFGMPAAVYHSYGDRIAPIFVSLRTRDRIPHRELNGEEAVARIRPGGNGRGPMHDLGRFYEALLPSDAPGHNALLDAETLAAVTSRQRTGITDETFQMAIDWGLGFILNTPRVGPHPLPYGFGEHASPNTFGHGGSQSSSAFADPEHGLVVSHFTNGMPGEARHNRRVHELNTAIYEDLGIG